MNSAKVGDKRKRRRAVNVVQLGDESFYIRLDSGKKYLLDASGCWRCGSTARCFGNMIDDTVLEVICEFDFFDEVRSLFLLLVKDRVNKLVSWLRDKISDKSCHLVESMADIIGTVVNCVNVKKKL